MALIKDLTVEDLEAMIDEAIERKLGALLGTPDPRTLDEIFESIDRNMWTPPPGAKSSHELLREDRDR
jgi:hypothetical protein